MRDIRKALTTLGACALLSACAASPGGNLAPTPEKGSHIGILDDNMNYVGDCFAGFFWPDREFKSDGSRNWVFVDPYNGTAELQFDGRHLILKRTSHKGSEDNGQVRNRYINTDPQLLVELDYKVTDADPDGARFYDGQLRVKSAYGLEVLNLKGAGGCL
ncbi:MAG TPA: hypothetical protein VG839_02335 [Asticcacaulis sp.]|nr:hypothetical protein [Asticcacaulis sp.]